MRLPITDMVAKQWGAPPAALEVLESYADWLSTEGVRIGGIGPHEPERIDQRHISDSLVFAEAWAPTRPATLLDVGTGVGLPGLPLAILLPDTKVLLIDRSSRRMAAVRRVVRMLGLGNVTAEVADLTELAGEFEAVVARAVAQPSVLRPHLERLLAPGGCGVVGGSRAESIHCPGYETIQVGVTILDPPAWLLRIRRPSKEDQ